MVSAGLAHVNQLPADPLQRVFRGQTVRIRLAEPPDKLQDPEPGKFGIVYEDPWLMVIDKPAGLVAHAVGPIQNGTLTHLIQYHLDQQTVAKGMLQAGIVHRLDRMTSGLMVVAKEHQTHRVISLDFQAGRMKKSYLALVEGYVPFDDRVVTLPIGRRSGGRGVLMSAGPNALYPRNAKTKVIVLERRRRVTLIECRLYTGRNHQIRVHMAEIGHPVVGDEFYGPRGEIRSQPHSDGQTRSPQRHSLHAAGLGFRHPVLRTWLSFRSIPPPDFLGSCAALNSGQPA